MIKLTRRNYLFSFTFVEAQKKIKEGCFINFSLTVLFAMVLKYSDSPLDGAVCVTRGQLSLPNAAMLPLPSQASTFIPF